MSESKGHIGICIWRWVISQDGSVTITVKSPSCEHECRLSYGDLVDLMKSCNRVLEEPEDE